jgi:hypothetical protein
MARPGSWQGENPYSNECDRWRNWRGAVGNRGSLAAGRAGVCQMPDHGQDRAMLSVEEYDSFDRPRFGPTVPPQAHTPVQSPSPWGWFSEAGEGFDDGLLDSGMSEVAQVASPLEEGQVFRRENSLEPIQILNIEQEII